MYRRAAPPSTRIAQTRHTTCKHVICITCTASPTILSICCSTDFTRILRLSTFTWLEGVRTLTRLKHSWKRLMRMKASSTTPLSHDECVYVYLSIPLVMASRHELTDMGITQAVLERLWWYSVRLIRLRAPDEFISRLWACIGYYFKIFSVNKKWKWVLSGAWERLNGVYVVAGRGRSSAHALSGAPPVGHPPAPPRSAPPALARPAPPPAQAASSSNATGSPRPLSPPAVVHVDTLRTIV